MAEILSFGSKKIRLGALRVVLCTQDDKMLGTLRVIRMSKRFRYFFPPWLLIN
jgi:hypothetical protein